MKVSANLILFLLITNIFTSLFEVQEDSITFEKMFEHIKALGKKKMIAVAGAGNLTSLQTARKCKDLGIADFLLIGRIKEVANMNNIDISDFFIVDKRTDLDISSHTAKLVKSHKADIFYKDSLNPLTALKAIFKNECFRKNKLVI